MGKLYIAIILIFGSLIILFSNCSEEPQTLSSDVLNPNILGTLKDTVLYAINDSSYLTGSQVNTQLSTRLIVGSFKGIEARPIMRITDFSEIPDSATIIDAKIRLLQAGRSTSMGSTPFTVTIYPVLSAWTNNLDSVWSDYQQNFDPTQPYGTFEISPVDTNDLVVELNTDGIDKINEWLARFWQDQATSADENYGMIVDFSSADFIQSYYSINADQDTVLDPRLIASFTIPGDTTITTDTLLFNYDAYLYNGSLPQIPDRNYVSTLFPHSILIQFDVKSFLESQPRDFSLNSANLQLFIDKENSLVDNTFGTGTLVTLKLDKINSISVVADSSLGRFIKTAKWSSDSTIIEVNSGEERKKLARNILQTQLIEIDSTQGLVISFIDEINNNVIQNEKDFYSFLAFYTARDPNLALRPHLIITYWLPPDPRL